MTPPLDHVLIGHLRADLGAEFLGYEHHVVLLAPVTIDETIKTGTSLAIKATLSALACTDSGCVPVSASATLNLETSSAAGPEANGKLFEKARAALPPPLAEAPYLKGSRALASHTKIPVKGSGELLVVARIEPLHHIQARDPGVEGLIPTRLFIEPVDGIEFGKIKWPEAHVREMEYFGKVREYNGEAVFRVPFTVTDAKFQPGPVKVRLLLHYQCCTDAGACYPPETAEAFVTFDVVAEGSPAVLAQTGVSPTGPLAQAGAAEPSTTPTPSGGANPSLLLVFLGAFLGGVILNIMPCVLPVISLKIFGFMQQAGEDRGRVFRMGLVYALGIMGSFLVVAIIMVVLSAPWGALMQYPMFVIVFSGVILALALSLFGVFEIQLPGKAMDAADAAGRRESTAAARRSFPILRGSCHFATPPRPVGARIKRRGRTCTRRRSAPGSPRARPRRGDRRPSPASAAHRLSRPADASRPNPFPTARARRPRAASYACCRRPAGGHGRTRCPS
ncbi:MAG: hypothetical protein IIA73_10770 [Proteobacteria bacterium]|nr:hypothetical protein [Pseudomonadota bacterium]